MTKIPVLKKPQSRDKRPTFNVLIAFFVMVFLAFMLLSHSFLQLGELFISYYTEKK